jgi:hypothetical protein
MRRGRPMCLPFCFGGFSDSFRIFPPHYAPYFLPSWGAGWSKDEMWCGLGHWRLCVSAAPDGTLMPPTLLLPRRITHYYSTTTVWVEDRALAGIISFNLPEGCRLYRHWGTEGTEMMNTRNIFFKIHILR